MPAWMYNLLDKLIGVLPEADMTNWERLSDGFCEAFSALGYVGRLLCTYVDCDMLRVAITAVVGLEVVVLGFRALVWLYKLLPLS